MQVPMASPGSRASAAVAEKVQGSKEQAHSMNVFIVLLTPFFNSCNEAEANSLPWVKAGDLDVFFRAAQQKVLCTMRKKQVLWGKKKLTNSLSAESVIIPEEY